MRKPIPHKAALMTLTALFLTATVATVKKYRDEQEIKEEKYAAEQFEQYVNHNTIYPLDIDEKTTILSIHATGFILHYHIEVDDWYDKDAVNEFQQAHFGLQPEKHLCQFNRLPYDVIIDYTVTFLGDQKEVTHQEKLSTLCPTILNLSTANIGNYNEREVT